MHDKRAPCLARGNEQAGLNARPRAKNFKFKPVFGRNAAQTRRVDNHSR